MSKCVEYDEVRAKRVKIITKIHELLGLHLCALKMRNRHHLRHS